MVVVPFPAFGKEDEASLCSFSESIFCRNAFHWPITSLKKAKLLARTHTKEWHIIAEASLGINIYPGLHNAGTQLTEERNSRAKKVSKLMGLGPD